MGIHFRDTKSKAVTNKHGLRYLEGDAAGTGDDAADAAAKAAEAAKRTARFTVQKPAKADKSPTRS